MSTSPERPGTDAGAAADVANLGLLRPPLVYLCSILTGLALHIISPLPFVPPAISTPLGGALALVAIALFLFSVRTLRAADTPVRGNRPATVVVHTGPYRFSRNPIYLSFSILQLGITIWVNGLWVLATLVPALALMAYVVIPREERYLERRFGTGYLQYKASVRRWL